MLATWAVTLGTLEVQVWNARGQSFGIKCGLQVESGSWQVLIQHDLKSATSIRRASVAGYLYLRL